MTTTLDLFDWDVVYATTFAALDRRLHDQGWYPTDFSGEVGDNKASGSWGCWEILGDAPSDFLWLQGTVDSGTAVVGGQSIDLGGSRWTVQVSLHDAGGGSFRPASSPPTSPHLAQFDIDLRGAQRYQVQELMVEILGPQILGLGEVVNVNLEDHGVLAKYPWLRPTSANLALQALGSKDERKGIVAVLAMTQGRSGAGNQLAVDSGILCSSQGVDGAALAIGPGLLTEQLLRPSLAALVQGSTVDDFTTDKAGVVLYNPQQITWGSFSYDLSNGETSTIEPTIPKGNIELSLEKDLVHLSMSDIHFRDPSWGGPGYITVAFDTEAFIHFDFVLRKDGGLVMVPKPGDFSGFNVTITPSESLQIFQIALDVALQVLFAVLGGIVESVTGPAEQAVNDAVEEGAEGSFGAEMGAETVDGIAGEATEEEVQEAREGAAQDAGEALANEGKPGYLQKFKAALWANRYKIGLKLIEKMVEIPAGKIESIAVYLAKEDYDQLPDISAFAKALMEVVTWQQAASFKVESGALEGSLVFRGTLTSAEGSKGEEG
ncbi:MAG: hypothetical protein AAGD01_15715 [Acidobacteriota bacterium]